MGIEPVADRLSRVTATGEKEGFAVDIARAVARDQILEIELVAKPWTELLEDFRAHRIDILAAVVATPERDALIAYSAPHIDLKSGVFLRAGSPSPATLSDLKHLTFGTTQQSAGHLFLQSRGFEKAKFYPRLVDVLAGLDRGECDAVLAVRLFGRNFTAQEKYRNIVESDLDLPEMHYRLRLGVHHEATALLAKLNDGLVNIRADGQWEKIYEEWIGPLETRRLRLKDIKPYLAPAAVLLAVIIGALLAQRRLLRQLQRQTIALQATSERLTLVLEGSEDGFWDWDMRTNQVQRSERWAAMLGFTLAEIPPTLEAGTALVHPEDRRAFDAFQARFNAGSANRYDLEYRMRTKDGQWRWVLDRGKVVTRAADGAPLRMSGTHTDITARKLTEQALTENRELLARSAHLLAQTQAVAKIGGWEFDLRTQKLYWSDQTYRLHETTPAEFQPTVETAIEFYTPASQAVVREAVGAAVQHGAPYDLELEILTAKRNPIRIHTTGRAEMEDGRVVKLYGSFRDITQEKAAELAQRKIHLKMLETQKLESLGVLAGGIAHDFNNLLTVILANVSFAREAAPGRDAESLAAIESAAHRASDLCRQMLAYAGQSNLHLEPLDLGNMVNDTARLLLVSISKKAELHTELAPQLPAVEGDASQLRQVVMNLVINASESLGDAAGTIHLRTRPGRPDPQPGDVVHSFDLPAGNCVCLEVIDTGGGMDAATLARVFDPFFTTKFTGRGLGLAATLGIVRTHHGALVVRSSPGRGSTFQLFLGACVAMPAAQPAPAAPPPPNAGGRVLLVDDEPAVLRSADVLLRSRGYDTVLATDGVEALEKFRATPTGFTAVLLDLTMPRLDGAEVLREIRALNPSARVLIMSGFSEQDVRDRLRGLGPIEFLHKPFALQTLLTRLGEVITA